MMASTSRVIPRIDEEDRDEEAVPHRVEFRLEQVDVTG
jgi:hypothetical protein